MHRFIIFLPSTSSQGNSIDRILRHQQNLHLPIQRFTKKKCLITPLIRFNTVLIGNQTNGRIHDLITMIFIS